MPVTRMQRAAEVRYCWTYVSISNCLRTPEGCQLGLPKFELTAETEDLAAQE
jgi:hypothetical protein